MVIEIDGVTLRTNLQAFRKDQIEDAEFGDIVDEPS